MHRRKLGRYEKKRNCTNCAIARDALENQIYREAYKAAHDDLVRKVITAVMGVLAIIDGVVSVITLVGILQRVLFFIRKRIDGSRLFIKRDSPQFFKPFFDFAEEL